MTKKNKKIIVNCLTGSRILGALSMPLILSFSSIPGLISLISFLFITDFLDGKLARRWKVQTKGGALLDPICDKALAFSCLLSLIGTNSFLIVPLFFESCIAAINISKICKGENTPSTMVGKAKTWILSITLVLCTINAIDPNIMQSVFGFFNIEMPNVTNNIINTAIGATALAEAMTAVSYMKPEFEKKEKSKRQEKIDELYSIRETLVRLFDENRFEEDKNKTLSEIRKKEGKSKCL